MNTELYHFGVKGMRWGVRKSKYHSGPRHSGKKTNSKRNSRLKTAAKIGLAAGAAYGAYRLTRKNDMYSSLMRESKRYSRMLKSKSVRDAVKNVLYSSGTKAATTVLTGAGVYAGRKAAQKIFKDDAIGKDIFLKKK